MEYMRGLPDKAFDLAIVDPPYGGGQHFNFRYGVGDSVYRNDRPNREYWQELFRVSTNQIVWGGNYFTETLPVSRCWTSWYKANPAPNFSDFELAWTSFDAVSKQVNLTSYGFRHADKEGTIHPTQKPVALYRWLLQNYAKPGQRILDTHLGSGSIAIACDLEGFDLVGCEIDADYITAARKRLADHQAQPRLFDAPKTTSEQLELV